jgi:tripartite-type tricarboxylate transporter receptor subunit TctC
MNRRPFVSCFLAGLVAAALSALVTAVHAQAWPAKPIRVIVPYTPGGFTDITARLVTQKLQERLGQPVVIDNKPGANSIIGVDALAKSPPDGYTFAVVIAAYAANTTLYPKLPYDPKRDLMPVSLIGISPLVAAVNNDTPFRNAAELIEYARKNPGRISYGSSGNGSAVNLTTELLKSMTKTHMVHIPYRGSAPALADLMGGHIQLFMDAAVGLIAPGKAGKVRLIGVASESRLPALPDVPTFVEQGIKGFTGSTWAGILAPAGTPPAVAKRVADEVAAIVKLPDVKQKLDEMGTIPVGNSPPEFDAFLASETVKWGQVIRAAKITAE